MRRRLSLGAIGLGWAMPIAAGAQVVNFHADNNGQGTQFATSGGYNLLYYGQGAYSDPGHNIWNGFGQTPGPGSTYFYGPGLPDNPQLPGNPGNPYAVWHDMSGFHTSSGSNLFAPTNSAVVAGNATSAGTHTPITLSANYAFDNGATGNTLQGHPSFLVGQAAVSNATSPVETFTLHNVPTGTYDLYLYGANYDNNRGTLFAVSSGTPDSGISATLNQNNGTHPGQSFIEGVNYVLYHNVMPNGSGDIVITASPNPVDGIGNNNFAGETDVNGFQLVTVPEPASLGVLGLGALGLITRRRRRT